MKITKQDLATIQAAIATKDTDTARAEYKAAGYSLKRYQWDCARAAGLIPFLCDVIYKYADDSHFQTALNKCIPTL